MATRGSTNMALKKPVAFSPNGEYFAHSTPDGTLRIWETSTGTLKQEYTPSSHLSATCSCLTWGLTGCGSESPRKKKKKRKSGGAAEALDNLNLVVMGTTSGALLMYSVVKGDLHTQLVDGHTDVVHDACWREDGTDSLFTCSADSHVVEWQMSSSTVKEKWQADRGPVYCVCMAPSKKHLLTASRAIKLWDLDTMATLKTFTGHATEVLQLLRVPCLNCGQSEAGTSSSAENSYFLSAAVNDRLVNAWQVNTSSKSKNSLASFSLPDEPVHIFINLPTQQGQPYLLLVVTKSGQLLIFEHLLNGRLKKPLKHKVRVQIATQSSKEDTPRPIPVLCSTVCDGVDRTLLLVHGNSLKPTFERKPYESLESETCLIRDDPNRTSLQSDTTVSKVKTPGVSQDATVLHPAHLAPAGPSRSDNGETKPKKKRRKSTDLTMEERLNAISIDKPSDGQPVKELPRADTLATLLAQGLQSKDKKILNSVLQNTNDKVIHNTVKRLPMPVIVPLVQELSKRMHGHAQSGRTQLKWVKALLTLHTAYLMTFPELVESFSSLYQMMESRVEVFGRLSRLQGKLDLMLSQIASQDQEEDDVAAPQQPLMVYQDDSSDEDFAMHDVIPDNSESEDNWENLSDMDTITTGNGDLDSDNNMEESNETSSSSSEDEDAGD